MGYFGMCNVMCFDLGRQRSGDTLVKTIRVLLCAGAFGSALSGSFAAADAVDDLLAGKPVVISQSAAGVAPAPVEDRVLERMIERQSGEEESLSQDPLKVDLTEPSRAGLELTETSAEAMPLTAANITKLTLVPEPSAVALAVASLVYFLIFFRRRYSF